MKKKGEKLPDDELYHICMYSNTHINLVRTHQILDCVMWNAINCSEIMFFYYWNYYCSNVVPCQP